MSDSPNVMRGEKGGVIALIKKRHCPGLIDIGGCSLHHISNAISYGVGSLGDTIEEFAVDVHAFFKHRTGKAEEYKDLQHILDLPDHRILRFVGTRWLCMHQVAKRLLEQWPALQEYFEGLKKGFFPSLPSY